MEIRTLMEEERKEIKRRMEVEQEKKEMGDPLGLRRMLENQRREEAARKDRKRQRVMTRIAESYVVVISDDEEIPVMDLTSSWTPEEPSTSAVTPPSIKCPVCLDSMLALTQGRHVLSTKCGHMFCSGCLPQSIGTSGQCPTCKQTEEIQGAVRIFI